MIETPCLVIGAGIGGMTAACLLQQSGVPTTLIEAHDKPGGCAGYFDWAGVRFNAGATVVAGLWPGGTHRWVLDRIGGEVESQLVPEIAMHLPDARATVAYAPGVTETSVRQAWPHLGDRVPRFFALQQRLADTAWRLSEGHPLLPPMGLHDLAHDARLLARNPWPALPWLTRPGRALLEAADIGRDPRDRGFIALLNMLLQDTVQTDLDAAPALNCALGLDIYRQGVRHCTGGMASLHEAHLTRFCALGGELQYGERVTGIERASGRYVVSTRTGKRFATPRLIANLTVRDLVRLYPGAAASWARRAVGLDQGWGAFTLYLAVRREALPVEVADHHQILLDYERAMGDGNNMLVSMAPPGDPMGGSDGLRVMTVSTHTPVGRWSDLSREEYRAAKQVQMDFMIDAIESRGLPGLRTGLEIALAGTPKSFRTWTHRHEGRVGGLQQALTNTNFRSVPAQVPGEPLWLVGDTVFPGQGTVACALSGINAWRRAMRTV